MVCPSSESASCSFLESHFQTDNGPPSAAQTLKLLLIIAKRQIRAVIPKVETGGGEG